MSTWGSPVTTTRTVRIVVNRDIPIGRISFADPALQACVDASGAVTTGDLTSLDCASQGVEDLGGLEYLTYLTSADLSGNAITTLDPVRLSESLRGNLALDVSGSTGMRCLDRALLDDLFGQAILPASCAGPEPIPVDDLVFASNFFQYCWDGKRGDVARKGLPAIRYADQVESLDCEVTGWPLDLADLPELLPFRNLSTLRLGGFDLDGSSPADPFQTLGSLPLESLALGSSSTETSIPLVLPVLPDLRTLDLDLDDLPDLAFLAQTPGLATLEIRDSALADYGPLATLAGLTDLRIHSAGLSDASVLPALPGLERLSLQANGFSDAGPLAAFTSLEYLSLRWTSVIDLTAVATLPLLTELVVDGAGYPFDIDFSTLVGAPSLRTLSANTSYLESIPPAFAQLDLDVLNLRDNWLDDYSGLADLDVPVLDLSGNYLNDVTPIAAMPALETLRIRSFRSINDGLDTLAAIPTLTFIDVYDAFGYPTPCGDVAALRAARPDIRLFNALGVDQDCGV